MSIVRNYFAAILLWIGGFRRAPKGDQPKNTVNVNKARPDRDATKWIGGLSSGVGIAGLGAGKLLSMLGFTAVAHSSGATILTGAGGYIAGTYGLAAGIVAVITAPFTFVIFIICLIVGAWTLFRNKKRK